MVSAVAHAELRIDPDQARLELKSPCVHDRECFSRERICHPEMQMSVVRDELVDGFRANGVEFQRRIVIVDGTACRFVGV